jgi:phosphoribosylformimino-5-aminoimidazole carboxamide ribotide isomerase
VVVRGVAGRRHDYRPIVSPWSRCADPIEIVQGMQAEWGLSEFYVADLDAIQFGKPNWHVYRTFCEAGLRVLIDAGVRGVAEGRELLEAGIDRVIVALETLGDPGVLREMAAEWSERLVFSLDLMQGRPMTRGPWQSMAPLEIALHVVEIGVPSLIVLDLAAVGVGEGISTLHLCKEIRELAPSLELITGGGVRNVADVQAAFKQGANAVLVASALHDRRLNPLALTTAGESAT